MPVHQYIVTLSTMWSRVRVPDCCPSRKAREIFQAPRSWVEASYPNLAYFNKADRGGHFAAWEEPELFAAEMRAAFSSLR